MSRFGWSRHVTSVAIAAAVAPFMVRGTGTDAVSSAWMLTFMGAVPIAVGMARGARQPRLWEGDEVVSKEVPADGTGRAGLVITVAGVVTVIAALLLAVAVTSRLYGTETWTEDDFGLQFTLLLPVVIFSGVLVTLAGLTKMQGSTPFPHWRVGDRPPGTS